MASPSVFNQFYTWLAAAWLDWAGLVGLPPGYFVVVWDYCVICNSLWLFIVFRAMGWRWWGKTRPADVVRFVQLWRCNGQKANKESLLHYNSKNRFFLAPPPPSPPSQRPLLSISFDLMSSFNSTSSSSSSSSIDLTSDSCRKATTRSTRRRSCSWKVHCQCNERHCRCGDGRALIRPSGVSAWGLFFSSVCNSLSLPDASPFCIEL